MPTIFDEVVATGPGPAHYTTETYNATGKEAPAFTMSHRYPSKESADTPGPGSYDNNSINFKRHAAAFTLRGRLLTEKPSATPGPADYRVDTTSVRDKGFTMGRRYKDASTRDTSLLPGPGDYDSREAKDSILTKQASFTMSLRYNTTWKDKGQPGPADYHVSDAVTKSKSTSYIISNRHQIPAYTTLPSVGPGSYDTSAASSLKQISAAFTISGRQDSGSIFNLTEARKLTLVGPASYRTEDWIRIGKDAPARSISERHKDLANKELIDRPGPSDYGTTKLSSSLYTRAPAYSLKGREEDTLSSTFGLGTHSLPQVGPGSYETNKSTLSRRGFTLGSKYGTIHSKDEPGPADYSVLSRQDLKNEPCFTMGNGRSNKHTDIFNHDANSVPGPAEYSTNEAEKCNSVHQRPAAFTIRSHTFRRTKYPTPSPADYYIEGSGSYAMRKSPAFSLSSRCKGNHF